ncbi:sensor histidine kinase [Bacillus horti]|uniref:histidine kinase n=1 Tax=Caldalkalibacillus horti TaxID=77523 RepID=A0ABT9VUS0_9BACI|nr:HAMP domain-containing sensor histidine kinase [Bacillus horti]MDQ0164714.1 signal transduction histidine kinase [Bacillus horti]
MNELRTISFIQTIRWKFIFVIVISIALAIGTIFLCYYMGFLLIKIPVLSAPLKWLVERIGSSPVMWVSGVVLFLLYFFILSRRVIAYIEKITVGLQEISEGNLDYKLEVKSSDELGMMAGAINEMAQKLKKLMEDERKAEKSKNELITGVSHDLRTPLTSILGYLELIEDDRYKDEVEFRYYTNIAYTKALRLKKLIDDLFEYTSIHDKGPLLKSEKINVSGFINQVVEEFAPVLEAESMSYQTVIEDPTLYIQADGNLLVRAYENLMMNAVRYGKKGKHIDVRIREQGGEAVIEIINYGEPIPERDLPFIFDRFYRAEKSRTSESGGTGLGLAITKSIVELNGGRISASSDQQKTTFQTKFPIVPV